MSDDINKKIQQISQLLGQDEMPDNVKNLLSVLANSMSSGGKDEEQDRNQENSKDGLGDKDIEEADEFDLPVGGPEVTEHRQTASPNEGRPSYNSNYNPSNNDLAGKLKSAVNSLGNMDDPRINLLIAIKPFLNSNRRDKIGNCVQLLQMTSITRLLSEQDK